MDYDEAGDFKEGLAPVSIESKFTFIDKKGNLVGNQAIVVREILYLAYPAFSWRRW